MIAGWREKYLEILKEFDYDKDGDMRSAIYLDSILNDSKCEISKLISNKDVMVIGAGPSLSRSLEKIKHAKATKIVADSALKLVLENDIIPDIIVTDLDGDKDSLEKISKTRCVFVVHAHGDNIQKLDMAKKFKDCIGTTQAEPFGRIENFGGFTDGDRSVFLASYFGAKRIILVGMDFGKKIGVHSNTKVSERTVKLQKLEKAEYLLEWLATFTGSELYTTSKAIKGFTKISLEQI